MTTKMKATPAWRRPIDGLTGEKRYSHLPPVDADKRIAQDRAKGIPDEGVPWSYGTLESFLETVAGTNGKAGDAAAQEVSNKKSESKMCTYIKSDGKRCGSYSTLASRASRALCAAHGVEE